MFVEITATKRVLQTLVDGMFKSQEVDDLQNFKRCSAVYRYLSGESCAQISASCCCSDEAVRQWVHKFAAGGIGAFVPTVRRGRKSKLSKKQKAELFFMIEQGPMAQGFMGNVWNSAMVALLIEKKFGIAYAIKYVPQLLKSIGLSFQKAKFEATQKSEKSRSHWLTVIWPKIVRKAKRDKAKILFGDEASFAMWGSLSYTWAPRGKQPTVKTKGLRKSVKVFGLIEYGSGRTFYEVIDEQLNARTYINFLKSVLTATRSHLLLIQDGAKYHYSAEVLSFLDDKKRRLTPYKLPAYSPDLNPIEGLWKKIKAKGTHLVYFESFDKLMDKVAATVEWFAKRPDEVLPLFGSYA
jgi:hypothetical protein